METEAYEEFNIVMMCASKEEDSDEDIFSRDVDRRVRGKRDGSELTRKDLLAITGSADSSISMEDTVQISTAPRSYSLCA